MRFAPSVVAFLVLASFAYPSDCVAVERTAYVFQYDDDSLISLPLSASGPTFPTPTVIEGFDRWTSGSTLGQDGRIFTLDIVTDELIAVTPATGDVEVLCALSVGVQPGDDLLWGVDGTLVYSRQYGTLRGFHRFDPETCLMTLLGTADAPTETVEHHQSQYYAGGGLEFSRIDPQTFDVTLIRDLQGFEGGCNVWGLSSVGGNLWRGMTCWGGTGISESFVDLVDPITGWGDLYIRLPPFVDTQYLALEVIEQPSPAEVSTLQPIGFLALILALMVAGVLVLWRR